MFSMFKMPTVTHLRWLAWRPAWLSEIAASFQGQPTCFRCPAEQEPYSSFPRSSQLSRKQVTMIKGTYSISQNWVNPFAISLKLFNIISPCNGCSIFRVKCRAFDLIYTYSKTHTTNNRRCRGRPRKMTAWAIRYLRNLALRNTQANASDLT